MQSNRLAMYHTFLSNWMTAVKPATYLEQYVITKYIH